MPGKPKVVVIAGPTASGKTRFGVELALDLDGEIINADSMQVYRGMDVGTAKPTAEEKKGIPHHIIDVVDPDEEFNAAIYRSMALSIIGDIHSQKRTVFIVGGTGLYIKALLGGLIELLPADPDLRRSLHLECESHGSYLLHERLRRQDPRLADTIHPNDRIRVIRALEMIHMSKCRPSSLIREHGFRNRPFDALKFCLRIDREELYNRINRRSVAMVEAGLAEETENLLGNGYSPGLKPMKAIGYRHMVKYLEGDWSLEETIRNLQKDTRKYAKRQLTWFRADPDVMWVAPEDFNVVENMIKGFLSKTV